MIDNALTIALSKGRIFEETLPLLAAAGIVPTENPEESRKLIINTEAIERDLEGNWAVCAEGIQTILRREGYPNPYEALKQLTRTNQHITRESITQFIDQLDVDERVKQELRRISPQTYCGI